MEITSSDPMNELDLAKEEPVVLVSPKNPNPIQTIFLSNIDQAVTFPVEKLFFFHSPPNKTSSTHEIVERVKESVAEVLLVPYYFMAGRLHMNLETSRLEILCNNAGVLFVAAKSKLMSKDLGDLSVPNSTTFHHFVHRPGLDKSLAETALFTIQVTMFACGDFSIGFVTNHAILDGRSASEMFENLASICRGEGLQTQVLFNDRTCLKARDPPQIKFIHNEYVTQKEISSSLASCFTAPDQASPSPLIFSDKYIQKLVSFTPQMINALKEKAMTKSCSTFEVLVAHIWRARTKAVYTNPDEFSSVLFAVDIRSKISPPLPKGFVGNGVVTAFATAKVADLAEKPFSFCVEKMKEGRDRVTDEYVRSAIDWLEVYRGIPRTCNGNFYVSAWWKLSFSELDFGFGKAVHGGPVVSGNEEFVLLLSDNGKENINALIGLDEEKMQRFMAHHFEMFMEPSFP
ncbi:omega-hydroxypalmitate O-feruloyl transferase-like [Pistacia vera]|uniref:omega-hydroxypalmitate O-feruloyl transferase-like n=1 Tax=Pistacia vera TaxID=55513 RepID=UPI001263CF8A|nr:omega-hydroxypalmitate O-feruloyl transferase-like [Pistacia vera]XP_031287885.1 omega-hydroxypalmitate O-feruloyl transferase-like [Pistacia vera]